MVLRDETEEGRRGGGWRVEVEMEERLYGGGACGCDTICGENGLYAVVMEMMEVSFFCGLRSSGENLTLHEDSR